ncbi:MAG: BREX system ATP-binding protein BrxD [Planctomycetaceae bacterium]|nr:BREX system ATP-binding protein BrxD [Planctomycetaceae bacterium]
MTTLSSRDIRHVFESLRKGTVPERGVKAYAVGIERQRKEILRQLEFAADGEGSIKFLRGAYGGGKTFMSRLALQEARDLGFATSFVVVSDNDMKFHRFEDVYRRVMADLGTSACPRGALSDILDRWIGRVEDGLIDSGADENADDFDSLVHDRISNDLLAKTGGEAPEDFIRVVQTIFELKQQGDAQQAGALISWLCGSRNVAATAKKRAAIKKEIGSNEAMPYLRGVLEIVKAAGYTGLVIVIDEAETILRMRRDQRHKSLNGIRQIADAANSYPGLLWLFTGTAEFFDSKDGVASVPALHERIGFQKSGNAASLRQPQLELTPFDRERLRQVSWELRALYPSQDRPRIESRISDQFVESLIDSVTAGFKGEVGIVPRQYLRRFVMEMDLVDEDETYQPAANPDFQPAELNPEEQLAFSSLDLPDSTADGEQVW